MFWPSKTTMNNIIKRNDFEIIKFQYCLTGDDNDKITLKGRLFKRTFLKRFSFMSPVLFYILKKN